MIKPEQVPTEAWLAMRDYVAERPYGYDFTEAIAAALNAWPGMEHQTPNDWSNKPHLILPLPAEVSDE